MTGDLRITAIEAALAAGDYTLEQLIEATFRRTEAAADEAIWISQREPAAVLAEAHQRLAERSQGRWLPLLGVPFAVKDNIAAAGLPTRAACPALDWQPGSEAEVVRRLRAAGALLIGKTNMDQFATGLVGVRSPYGTPRNPFAPAYVPGGSSSGSAVAVSRGLVSFALGTDTAGSGRVPAAFTSTVGLKPTCGLISTTGVLPACRSLDCVSIFALTATDAGRVLEVIAGFDPLDPYARRPGPPPAALGERFRFALPRDRELEFFGDRAAEQAFAGAVETLRALGGEPVEIDFRPFLETARLLYDGPWVAERLADLQPLLEAAGSAADPVVQGIVLAATGHSASALFSAWHRLAELRRAVAPLWQRCAVLVTPTAPTIYTVAAVRDEPLLLNSRLGYYTNFVNLLDLAAVAVPAGLRSDGLPFGITLAGPAWSDPLLGTLAERVLQVCGGPLGATGLTLPPAPTGPASVALAVVGAHLGGQPLNHQLTGRGGRLLASTRTAPRYRLYALAASDPAKPGLVRTTGDGHPIEVEVWQLPIARFGELVASVPAPLAIGSVELADGQWVKGFLCEPWAVANAPDISRLGGWRAYLAGR